MTDWQERFDKHDDEDHDFDLIPEAEQLHTDRKICGMMKLYTLLKEPPAYSVIAGASHDVIWLDDDLRDDVTDDDILYLVRCGIHWSSEGDCPAMFC